VRIRAAALRHSGSAFVFGLFTTSCSFLLDFDQFETRVDCHKCHDVDPCEQSECTRNGCLPDPQSNESCKPEEEPLGQRCSETSNSSDGGEGGRSLLVARHRLVDLAADKIGKTQIVVGRDYLYHVAYVEQGGSPDVLLRAFALDAFSAEPDVDAPIAPKRSHYVSEFLKTDIVQSPGSVAVDPLDRVVLYVAYGTEAAQTATLGRMTFAADLSEPGVLLPLTDPPNYRVSPGDGRGRVGPEAGYLDTGQPFVAWQGCKSDVHLDGDLCGKVAGTEGGSAIFAHAGEDRLDSESLSRLGVDERLSITAMQALSGGAKPAAVWGTSSSGEVSIVAGTPSAGVSLPIFQCNTSEQYALTSLHAAPMYNGFSSIVWSKRLPDGTTSITETASMACGSACVDLVNPPGQCDGALYQRRVFDWISAAAHGVWLPDPTNHDDAVIVSAKIYQLEDTVTRLTVSENRGSPDPNVFPYLEPHSSEPPLAIGTPSWPELNLQPRSRRKADAPFSVLGVGWVETSSAGAFAKVQTYDLCVPL
jgi:hypothetical protein